jgi:ribosomal protein S1
VSRHEHDVSPRSWQEFVAAHNDGVPIEGRVVSVVPFGAFVDFGDGVQGLLHKSEWVTEPEPGATVSVRIVDVDPANRRFSLRPAGA